MHIQTSCFTFSGDKGKLHTLVIQIREKGLPARIETSLKAIVLSNGPGSAEPYLFASKSYILKSFSLV